MRAIGGLLWVVACSPYSPSESDQQGPVVPSIQVELTEPARAGQTVSIRATMPIQRAGLQTYVAVAQGGEGAGICPPALGGDCLGVLGPMEVVGPVTTDANGIALLTWDVPPDYPSDTLALQVGVLSSGRAYLSTPASFDVSFDDAVDALAPSMWLDATWGVESVDGAVTAWRDRSGNGHDVTQVSPDLQPQMSLNGLGGRPALVFDGDDHLYRADGFSSGSYTKVVLFEPERFQGPNNVFSSTAGGHVLFYQREDAPRMLHGSEVFAVADTPSVIDGTTWLIATYDATTGVGTLYQDGAELGVVGTNSAPLHTDTSITIGGHNGGNGLHGRIGEVLSFDRVLDTTERATLDRYFEQRTRVDGSMLELQPSLWLTADEGVIRNGQGEVTLWRDRSGAGLDVSPVAGTPAPTLHVSAIDGRAAVEFDGVASLARNDGFPDGSYTKVVVYALDDLAQRNSLFGSGRTSGVSHNLWYSTSDQVRMRHAGNFAGSNTPTELGRTTQLVATYDAATRRGALYQDGVQVGTGSQDAHSMVDIQIGGNGTGPDRLFGRIAEVLAFERPLSPADLDNVHAYLARRYPPALAERVQLTEFPRTMEVRGRDGNVCTAEVSGMVDDPATQLTLTVTPERQPAETFDATVQVDGSFVIDWTMDAGRIDHEVTLTVSLNGESAVAAMATQVTCGDLYLVMGQSNAVASVRNNTTSDANAEYGTHWVRSFGSRIDSPAVRDETTWSEGEGQLRYTAHAIGQWALALGHQLQLQHDMPIGILNGARGETSIAAHQKSDDNDLNLLYSRLLWRARTAGVAEDVRALFWYQGENDHDMGPAYVDHFDALYDAWCEDYPNLERVYVMQTRDGCPPSTAPLSPGHAPVWEYQRQLADAARTCATTPNTPRPVTLVSTTHLRQHSDSCHYRWDEYERLGLSLSPLVTRDLYSGPEVLGIDSVGPECALRQGSQIVVTVDDPNALLAYDDGFETDFTVDDPNVVVTDASVAANDQIVLELDGPTNATEVTFRSRPRGAQRVTAERSLCHPTDPSDPCWGIGILQFNAFPVTSTCPSP